MTRERKSEGRDKAAVGERLRLTREAMGKDQAEFCKTAGIARNTYNQYETAKNLISLPMAHKLCDAYENCGLTLDWIYRGDNGGMRESLAEAIRAMRRARKL